jgi:hypothetical protein
MVTLPVWAPTPKAPTNEKKYSGLRHRE